MRTHEALDRLCRELKLSEDAILAVRRIVGDLSSTQAGTFKSGRARSDELERLKRQAKALSQTLQNLDAKNSWQMMHEVAELGFPGVLLDPDADERVRFECWMPGLVDALKIVVEAAGVTQAKIPAATLRSGRTSTLHLYALHVSNLDFALSKEGGPQLARNGDFERLCDAIFEAAKIPTKSEGAIKYLQDWRAKDGYSDSLLWDH